MRSFYCTVGWLALRPGWGVHDPPDNQILTELCVAWIRCVFSVPLGDDFAHSKRLLGIEESVYFPNASLSLC